MTSGPPRTCNCEDVIQCGICRRREQQRRYAHGLDHLPVLPLRRFRESRLRLPSGRVDLAYLAGLFDGEGCITKYASNNNWVVQIGMTDRDVIEYLASLGGSMRVEPKPAPRKTLYRWRLLAQADVQAFLEAVLPYLRVKRSAAEVCLQDQLTREQASARQEELLALERLA